MKTKLTSITSRQVTEGSRSSWLQILGNQIINRSAYINCQGTRPVQPQPARDLMNTDNLTGCVVIGKHILTIIDLYTALGKEVHSGRLKE